MLNPNAMTDPTAPPAAPPGTAPSSSAEPTAKDPATTKDERAKAQPPGEPPLPIFGGRLMIGIALLFGIAAVSPQGLNSWLDRKLHPKDVKPAAEWTVGSEADVQLTLITADARRLHCAHDAELEGYHCAYKANKRPWPKPPGALLDDNGHHLIQPYRTADTNALILVGGLWAEPELALRVHREPPTHYEADKLIRFVAYCRVRFIGKLEKAALRWDLGGAWTDDQTALVARPLSCTLEPPAE